MQQCEALRGYALQEVLDQPNPWPYVAAAMTLANYLLGTPAVNGVAWTLIIEVFFYATVALLLPLLKTRPRVAIVVAFVGLALLQQVARSSAFVFLLAVNGVYVCYLFLGSLIYLRWAGRIGNGFLIVGSVAFWLLFLRGMRDIALQPPFQLSDYGVSYGLAWLAFVVLLVLDEQAALGQGQRLLLAHQLFPLSESRRPRAAGPDAALPGAGLLRRAGAYAPGGRRHQRRLLSLGGGAIPTARPSLDFTVGLSRCSDLAGARSDRGKVRIFRSSHSGDSPCPCSALPACLPWSCLPPAPRRRP